MARFKRSRSRRAAISRMVNAAYWRGVRSGRRSRRRR